MLGLLEHANVLWDPLHIGIEAHHFCWEIHQFTWMKISTIGIKVGKEILFRNKDIEGSGVMKVPISNLVESIMDDFCCGLLSGLVCGKIGKKHSMFRHAQTVGEALSTMMGYASGHCRTGKVAPHVVL